MVCIGTHVVLFLRVLPPCLKRLCSGDIDYCTAELVSYVWFLLMTLFVPFDWADSCVVACTFLIHLGSFICFCALREL